ncbi:MAG: hypothetical protein ABGX22_17600 [Pirellulaceae bacterium]|nr:hypothetical protein [Planctomycetaceae bacterium]
MALRIPSRPNDHLFGVRTLLRMKVDMIGTYLCLLREYGDAVSWGMGPYRFYLFFHPDHVHDVLAGNDAAMEMAKEETTGVMDDEESRICVVPCWPVDWLAYSQHPTRAHGESVGIQ